MHQLLKAGIDVIESGDDWRAWLDFAHRLHQYSFNNLVLIWLQRPDATSVASYRTWQSLQRQVRRGERALRVMAPITRRTTERAADGSLIAGSDGKPLRRQRVVGFRPAAVFDVSQTDGPSLPEPQRPALLTGAAPEGLWAALEREVAERGYRLLRAGLHDLGGANGTTKVDLREVWVRNDVDDAQAVKTLAHELAHVILHASSDDADEVARCRGVREVEAESVAHLVLAAHRVQTDGYSFPYVAAWAYPLAAVEHVAMSEIVSRTGTRVMNAARQLIDATLDEKDEATPGQRALSARVEDGVRRTRELREETATRMPMASGEREVLLAVLADTQAFYRSSARSSWIPGYLESRGLRSALVSHGLGHAPRGWTILTDHLRGLGYGDDHILAAGVASRAGNGHLIDHLRDRLTIPLRAADGQLVGFTGRVNPSRSERVREPKYVNTPGTVLFHKRDVLFGLAEHRSELQTGHRAVLCEGPLDAIAVDRVAASSGLDVVGLASAGTAFTANHRDRLFEVIGERPVCLAFDADVAGLAATERAWSVLTEHGPRSVLTAELFAGHDPASLALEARDQLAERLAHARPVAGVLAEHKVADAHFEREPVRELVAFRQLADRSERLPVAERAPYLLRIAELLHVEPTEAAAEVGARLPHVLEDRVSSAVGCAALKAHLAEQGGSRTPAESLTDGGDVHRRQASETVGR